MEIWCPYVTEHLCYLIKQSATGVNKTTRAEGQESTFQLVMAGPLREGPVYPVKNTTMLEKYKYISYNILSVKVVLFGVTFCTISLPFIFHLSISF